MKFLVDLARIGDLLVSASRRVHARGDGFGTQAQALERAGNHAKNVAKEICHLLQPAQLSSSCALA
jgi:hypothetical protein